MISFNRQCKNESGYVFRKRSLHFSLKVSRLRLNQFFSILLFRICNLLSRIFRLLQGQLFHWCWRGPHLISASTLASPVHQCCTGCQLFQPIEHCCWLHQISEYLVLGQVEPGLLFWFPESCSRVCQWPHFHQKHKIFLSFFFLSFFFFLSSFFRSFYVSFFLSFSVVLFCTWSLFIYLVSVLFSYFFTNLLKCGTVV